MSVTLNKNNLIQKNEAVEDLAYAKSQINSVVYDIANEILTNSTQSSAISPVSIIQNLNIHIKTINKDQLATFQTIFKCENVTKGDFLKAFGQINQELSQMSTEYFKYISANAFATTEILNLANPLLKEDLIYNENSFELMKLTNKWIEQHTNGKIKDFINEPTLQSLVNAVTLDFKWANIFNVDKTSPQPFYYENRTVKVKTMEMQYLLGGPMNLCDPNDPLHPYFTGMKYVEFPKYTALCLPYISNESHFPPDELEIERFQLLIRRDQLNYDAKELIILPKPGVDLSEVSKELTSKTLLELESKMKRADLVNLKLPLLKVNSRIKTITKSLLERSAKDDPEAIGFNRGGNLEQQMQFEQDEFGTRGEIVTGSTLKCGGKAVEFEVNRPFMFAIIKDTHVIGLTAIKDDAFLVKT